LDNWQDRAACAGLDTDLFFTDSARHAVEAALPGMILCGRCPVTAECLEYAIENRYEFGVFGGRTSEERKAIRRKTKAPTTC
jgi:WhiB family transcriptional regulator, redox-sensing transcriptional regulator